MEITPLLRDLGSLDPSKLQTANQKIQQLCHEDIFAFFTACLQAFQNSTLEANLRLQAGRLIERLLTTPDDVFVVSTSLKEMIVQAFFDTYNTLDDVLRKCVSHIITIMFGRAYNPHELGIVLTFLAQSWDHGDIETRKGLLTILKDLCTKLQENKNTVFKPDLALKIIQLSTMGMKMTENEDVQKVSLEVFQTSLPLFGDPLSNQETRQSIYDVLLNLLTQKALCALVLETMAMLAEEQYSYLSDSVQFFLQATELVLQEDDELLKTLTFEIWTAIADKEAQAIKLNMAKNLKLIPEVSNLLIPKLSDQLTDLIKDDSFDPERALLQTVERCLTRIVTVIGDEFLAITVPMIDGLISNENKFEQIRGLTLFSCAVSGCKPQSLKDLVEKMIPLLINIILSHSEGVQLQEIAAKVLKNAVQKDPRTLLYHPQFPEIRDQLILLIDADPQVSKHTVLVWDYISSAMKREREIAQSYKQKERKIDIDVEKVLDLLIQSGAREINEKDTDASTNAYAAAMGFEILEDNNPKFLQSTLKKSFDLYKDSFNLPEGPLKVEMQKGYTSLISTALYNLKMSANDPIVSEILDLIRKADKEEEDDKIFLLTGLACSLGPEFGPYVKEFGSLMTEGINKVNNPVIYKLSINAISEIVRACPEELGDSIHGFVNTIIPLVTKMTLENTVRLRSLDILEDIFSSCPELVKVHFDNLCSMYETALEYSLLLPKDKPEDADFIPVFRDLVIQSFFFFSQNEHTMSHNYEKIIKYGVRCYFRLLENSQYNLTPEEQVDIFTFLADLVVPYGGRIFEPDQVIKFQEIFKQFEQIPRKSEEMKEKLGYIQKVVLFKFQ